MNSIKIGWGEVSLIPEGRKINLAGQFYERITDQVETPISVTAMAIECGEDQAIFCSCDLVATSYKLLLAVRDRLSAIPNFPTDKVMVSAIHTHTSMEYANRSDCPDFGPAILKKLMSDVKYESLAPYDGDDLLDGIEAFNFVADKVAQAAVLAWNNRTEGMYAAGFGRAAVGMCRRVCYDDGSAKMWGDTNTANFTALEGGNDSGIELLFTFTPDKKLTGIIANVACTAQILEHRTIISSDFFGKLKGMLREKFGEDINLLALCSAAGDQCPRDMVRWVDPETPINDPNIVRPNPSNRKADPSMFDIKGCTLAARRIANEVFYAYEDIEEYISEAEFKHKVISLDVPLRRVTPAETESAIKAITDFAKANAGKSITFKENAMMYIHAGIVARSKTQEIMDVIPIEFHVLRLGDIAFATNPYELFLDYGNQIRARSKASQTFLVELSCGAYGYLPTEKAERGSHYSAYVSSGTAGHEGGDLLVRKTLTEINEMFK